MGGELYNITIFNVYNYIIYIYIIHIKHIVYAYSYIIVYIYIYIPGIVDKLRMTFLSHSCFWFIEFPLPLQSERSFT